MGGLLVRLAPLADVGGEWWPVWCQWVLWRGEGGEALRGRLFMDCTRCVGGWSGGETGTSDLPTMRRSSSGSSTRLGPTWLLVFFSG